MALQNGNLLSMRLPFKGRRQDQTASTTAAAIVPMYTPLWHATAVMATTADSWWEGGIPPARRRSRRAADAVVHAAVGVARRLQVVGIPALPANGAAVARG